jgi:hypothetical protein
MRQVSFKYRFGVGRHEFMGAQRGNVQPRCSLFLANASSQAGFGALIELSHEF